MGLADISPQTREKRERRPVGDPFWAGSKQSAPRLALIFGPDNNGVSVFPRRLSGTNKITLQGFFSLRPGRNGLFSDVSCSFEVERGRVELPSRRCPVSLFSCSLSGRMGHHFPTGVAVCLDFFPARFARFRPRGNEGFVVGMEAFPDVHHSFKNLVMLFIQAPEILCVEGGVRPGYPAEF